MHQSSPPAQAPSGRSDDRPEEPRLHVAVRGVSKAFGHVRALHDVSLDLRGGEVHALCGHNGAGKSTLVRILAGLTQPDEGAITVDGQPYEPRDAQAAQRAGVSLVDQELGLVGVLSIAENLVLGSYDEPVRTRARELAAHARELLDLVGLGHVDPRTPLRALQPGERKLVQIAQSLGRNARLLILDEPTAWLSHEESLRVFEAVERATARGAAVVYVSHRLDEVFRLCHAVTVMRDGQRVAGCAVDEIDKGRLIELMIGSEGRELAVPARERRGPAVRIRDVTLPPRLADFSLDIPGGSIVGLAGQIGSGASDVLRVLAGLVPHATGTLELDGRAVPLGPASRTAAAGVQYVPSERQREGLFLGQSVEVNLTATRLGTVSGLGGLLSRRQRRAAARRLAELVGVEARRLGSPVAQLSGGNQQKVLIGRCLEQASAELLLLDDPTRGVDVGGRAEIHRLVREAAAAGNTVLFLSTELDELLELADEIVTIAGGQIVARRPAAEATAATVLAEMTHASAADVDA